MAATLGHKYYKDLVVRDEKGDPLCFTLDKDNFK
jgi:hypothetical protein